MGLAILTTVATTRTEGLLGSGPRREAMTNGFGLAFPLAAGFALVSLIHDARRLGSTTSRSRPATGSPAAAQRKGVRQA